MSSTHGNDSRGPRTYCEPHDGARSPNFLAFKRNFKTGSSAHFLSEDDYSIWQACQDNDQGGNAAGADPLPGLQQAGYNNAVRRRKKRQAQAFERVYAHTDDERLREMLDAIPDNGRRGAEAWALLVRECDQGTSDLEVLQLRQDFSNTTIEGEVGFSEDTIIKFSRLLNSLNARILPTAGQRYTEDDMSIKLLSNITAPESLALEAVTELRAAPGARRFERQVMVGGAQVHIRDYQALVTHMDSIWRGLDRVQPTVQRDARRR